MRCVEPFGREQRIIIRLAVAILSSSLTACFSPLRTPLEMSGTGPGDAVDPARNADFVARYPRSTGDPSILTGLVPQAQIYPGWDAASGEKSAKGFQANATKLAAFESSAEAGEGGIELKYENADVPAIAKSIADILGLSVIIDPRVQGNITILPVASIKRKDLLPMLESALRIFNGAIVRDGNLIKIVPTQEAVGARNTQVGVGEPGFGVTVIPLRYTSAATLAKTADSFLAVPNALHTDPNRNLIFIQGTSAERESAADVIKSLDVEWLRNQSVAIYPLKSTSPDILIKELGKVFDTADGGQGQSTISFQPIARMNAVMAVARNRKFIDQATQWVKRLDRSDTSGTTIRIYRLEHGSAAKIAKILNDIFIGRAGSTASGDSAAEQLAPSTSTAQTKLDGAGLNNSNNGAASSAGPGSDRSGSKGSESDSSSNGAQPRGLFQNVRITADTANNSISIFSNQTDYALIERSIRELDRTQLQVEIEAIIAEVTLTDALQYGVQYYLGSSDVGASSNNGSVSLSSSAATALNSQQLPGLNVLLGQQASPKAVLSALSTLTSVKVLSTPSLVVADNQPAFLQAGDSVPISTGSATVLSSSNTIVNTITYQDTGVILKVWPHIHANGVVDLEIHQEISSVLGGSSAASPNLNPTISERRIHSTVSVMSGQTALLGGLIGEEDDKTQTGIPLLHEMRGIGDLFETTNGSKNRTEIIVFVKPTVIQNNLDAQGVAEAFRDSLSTMHANSTAISSRDITK